MKEENGTLDFEFEGFEDSMTNVDIDFDEVDDDLERFQQDDIVKDALSRGVDLRQYSRQIGDDLRSVELESVKDYVLETDNIIELHEQIQSCDGILARMQEMLLGFQADLGGISDEIKHLQDESHSLNVKLGNRRAVENMLTTFLQRSVLPPDLVHGIVTMEVEKEEFADLLRALDQRLSYALAERPPSDGSSLGLLPKDTASVRESLAALEKLRSRAVAKIRDWVLAKVGELRKPKTNVQMLQEQVLKKHSYSMVFVSKNAPDVSNEIRATYSETMGRTLFSLFKTYHVSLMKLQLTVAGRGQLLVPDDTVASSVGSIRGMSMFKHGRSSLRAAAAAATGGAGAGTATGEGGDELSAFSLAERGVVLRDISQPPILVHVAQAEGQRFTYETILRSVQKHLMDAATSEYLFLLHFFKERPAEMFLLIFARTLSLSLEHVEDFLFSCHDAIGILLMIRVTHAHRMAMERRRIPCLDAYFDRVNLLLWPRYKLVLGTHTASLQNANVRRLGAVGSGPHEVTLRYAELASSVMALTSSSDSVAGAAVTGDDMIMADLSKLRAAYIDFAARLSEQVPASGPTSAAAAAAAAAAASAAGSRPSQRKSQLVFLITNYTRVLEIFESKGVSANGSSSSSSEDGAGTGTGAGGGSAGLGGALAAEAAAFAELATRAREQYVGEELQQHGFSRLISFVLQTEEQLTSAGGRGSGASVNAANVDVALLEVLVREFAGGWKDGIASIYGSVQFHFSRPNFERGMDILKQVLTQLLLYYTRLQEIIRKCWTRPPPFAKDIVSTATILYEIKKYSHV